MKIVTSLSFQGQCREAFDFYAKVLGGKVTAAMPYGEGPPGMPMEPKHKDWLMHCWLEVGDQAGDVHGGTLGQARSRGPTVRASATETQEGAGELKKMSSQSTTTSPSCSSSWRVPS